jgi:hypothetical protein
MARNYIFSGPYDLAGWTASIVLPSGGVAALSTSCEYCAECSHSTINCPGLLSDSPIARMFRDSLRDRALSQSPASRCSKCDAPEWAGRKMCRVVTMLPTPKFEHYVCGDCASNGIPLAKQPEREPEPINYHAWQTPCDEGVGGL